MGDQLEFVDDNADVRLAGSLLDPGANEGDVLTVQADGSVAAAAAGGGAPTAPYTAPGVGTVTVLQDQGENVLIVGGVNGATIVSPAQSSSVQVYDAGATIESDHDVSLSGSASLVLQFDPTAPIGFYGATPVVQPVVPMTTPSVQDVIDALVALGIVAQSD